jgi:hypothetical protein
MAVPREKQGRPDGSGLPDIVESEDGYLVELEVAATAWGLAAS